jgi:very-short-patch-repair endonuclease
MKSAPGHIPHRFLTRADLSARGVTRQDIEVAVSTGRLVRVRRGRYLPADTHENVVRAARWGGRLDCTSLLAVLGVHVLDPTALHIHVDPEASRVPTPPAGVIRHWRRSACERADLRVDLVEALAQACRCQSPRDAIATLDSAWHVGLADERTLDAVFSRLPPRYRALRRLLDPRAESGQESIVRLILRAIDCDIEVQVQIAGVGRVDFVVGGWLIIECDSKAHHEGWDAQRRDRRRDIAAARIGYTTVRVLAEDVLYRREQVATALRDIIESRPARVHKLRSRPPKSRRRRASASR